MLHTFDIAHSVGSEDVCKRCFLLLAPAALGRGPLRPQRLPRVFVLHSPPSQFSFLRKGAICFVFAARAGRSYFGLHQNHAGEPSDWAGRRCAQCSSWRWATLVSVASSVL